VRYEISIGINDDLDLPWAKNIVVEADNEQDALLRAGSELGISGMKLNVLAIRTEEEAHLEEEVAYEPYEEWEDYYKPYEPYEDTEI
jgi:hypothetical protein